MKIKLIRATVAGGQVQEVGAVIDLPENEALFLISIGKAVKIDKMIKETTEAPAAPEDSTLHKKRG